MNQLLRQIAPITETAWSLIDEEAKRTLKIMLAARKLIDFSGPHGWDKAAVATGRTQRLNSQPEAGVEARLRTTLPLVELRTPFSLSRDELEAIGRGAKDPDLDEVRNAARSAAIAEDRLVLHGFTEAGIHGLVECLDGPALTISQNYAAYPDVVAEAVDRLRMAGAKGPYAIALGPRCHTGLTRSTTGGYPVMEHVRRLLDGPVLWTPALDGAVVVSLRGGDFELIVGQDFSIGYLEHSADTVRLYIQESCTFRVLSRDAAVRLSYAEDAAQGVDPGSLKSVRASASEAHVTG